jgi:hypothetical protein
LHPCRRLVASAHMPEHYGNARGEKDEQGRVLPACGGDQTAPG